MTSSDDRSWLDGEKKSFSELDRKRRERRGDREPRPRGKAAQERARSATRQYLREIDDLFSGGSKADVERLATAVRDALGTPGLADACRAYHAAAGLPTQASLISLFLDGGDREVVLLGLAALEAARRGPSFEMTGSLRSQLRMLSSGSDDEIAEVAEGLLAAL